jgi:putative N6-adenine-specific DNA methylase
MRHAFATTNRGLEQLLIQELQEFKVQDIQLNNAGVRFTTDLDTIMALNLQSNYSSRILLEIVTDNYTSEQDIYDLCYQINWHDYFNVEQTIKVKTTMINSPLNSLNFVNLKIKDAICDRFVADVGSRPSVNKLLPDIRIYSFLTQDKATIYIDTSGDSLFKRGYRQDKLTAPLKENLACGLIKLSNWQSNLPLLDPMCGSGTIIIEALRIALKVAPGLSRKFAFEHIKIFNQQQWRQIKNNAIEKINLNQPLHLYANDIDGCAISIAKHNLDLFQRQVINLLPSNEDEINQLFQCVTFTTNDMLNLPAPTSIGVLIANLPYGVRIEDAHKLAQFYPLLAKHLKNSYANWNTYFLTSDLQMPKLMRLKPSKKTPLFNGPLECRLFEIKMVAGSNRNT